MDLMARAQQLVDDSLIRAYWDAVGRIGTTDLVLYLDTEEGPDSLRTFSREELVADPEAPDFFKQKVSKPARDTAKQLKDGETAFWFMASFPDGIGCVSVIAQRMSPGGSA